MTTDTTDRAAEPGTTADASQPSALARLARRLVRVTEASDEDVSAVMRAFGEAFRPLAPLAAQVLWVAQPTMALFGEGDAVGALAARLEHLELPRLDRPSEGS